MKHYRLLVIMSDHNLPNKIKEESDIIQADAEAEALYNSVLPCVKVVEVYSEKSLAGYTKNEAIRQTLRDRAYAQGVRHCIKDVIEFLEATDSSEYHLDFFREQLKTIEQIETKLLRR